MYLINGILYDSLPFRIVTNSGLTRTNLKELDSDKLAELNIFKCKEIKPEILENQYYGEPVINVENNIAVMIYPVLNLSSEDNINKFNELKTAKKAEIAAARYITEISGTMIFGFKIATDRESQALITGAALAAVQNSEYTLNWKTLNGFITLTSPQIIAIADLVRAHVQKCFDAEALAYIDIDAATSKEELDKISWKL